MSGAFVSVFDLQKAVLAGCCSGSGPALDGSGPALDNVTAVFKAPSFFLHHNHLGFYTGVEKETCSAGFLLAAPAALQLVAQLEQQLGVSLRQARGIINAAEEGKYLSLQAVSIPTDAMYKAILKSFPKLVKQSRSQALYAESRHMLVTATRMAQPLPEPSPTAALQRSNGRSAASSSMPGLATMVLSLDFEWWERSEDVILEVGWSLWDSLTQQHRTRHWVIKEHLNKANGRFISDNRMRFLFGSSERGSLDKAMAALQAEVDAAGISEGLDRQQKEALTAAGVELVLVGHGMNSDVAIAELYEIEWPQSMQTFDTQKLYMAWQLKQLDAAAAAKALEAVVGGGKGRSKAAAGLEDELQELYDDDSADEDAAGCTDDVIPDEDDEGPAAAAAAAAGRSMAALSLGNGNCRFPVGSVGGGGSGANSPGGKASRKGKPQAQNPPRVRPWPAGPPPADPNRPASSEEQQQQQHDQAVKVERQVSLAGLLSALGIRFSKLHNAGNDARYTMEAFLALTGHQPCSDPLQAHLDFASQDSRYQGQIEASMAAAAALGWATPSTPSPGPSTPVGGASGPHSNNSSSAVGAGVFQGGAASLGNRPGSNAGSEGGAGGGGDWQRKGGQQQQQHGRAWGAGAAAKVAAMGNAGGAGVPSAGGAWGQSKQGGGLGGSGSSAWGAAPQQQQQQQQQKSNARHKAFNSTVDTAREVVEYEPNPDGW